MVVAGLFDYLFIFINDLVFSAEKARGGVSHISCGRNSSKEDEGRLIQMWSGPLQTTFKCKAAQDPVTGVQKDKSRAKEAERAISENKNTEALSWESVKVWLVWLSKCKWGTVTWLLAVSALETEENSKDMSY